MDQADEEPGGADPAGGSPPGTHGSQDDPLSAEQKDALRKAEKELHGLLRPARIASVNGWTVGIFGGLSVLWGLVAGGSGIVVGLLLVAVAWNELRGRNRLRSLDPEGARILGWNQIALGGVVAAYCAAAIVRARVAPAQSLQELEVAMGISNDVVASLTAVVYGGVAVVVALVQAVMARYHFGKRATVESFTEETPGWMLELLAR